MKRFLFIFVLFIYGCGYTTRPGVAPDFKTIYIEPFTNSIDITSERTNIRHHRTSIAGIEVLVTKNIEDVLKRDGRLRPVKKDQADVIMTGSVLSFNREALRYNPDGTIRESRIHITTQVAIRTKLGETLWTENISNRLGSTFAGATTDISALNSAIQDLSIKIRNRLLEDW